MGELSRLVILLALWRELLFWTKDCEQLCPAGNIRRFQQRDSGDYSGGANGYTVPAVLLANG
jgi:hypothetical protein